MGTIPLRSTSGARLLRTEEAAALLGYTPRTLAVWRHRGEGPPHVRINGRTVRYRRSDLEAWIAGLTGPVMHSDSK